MEATDHITYYTDTRRALESLIWNVSLETTNHVKGQHIIFQDEINLLNHRPPYGNMSLKGRITVAENHMIQIGMVLLSITPNHLLMHFVVPIPKMFVSAVMEQQVTYFCQGIQQKSSRNRCMAALRTLWTPGNKRPSSDKRNYHIARVIDLITIRGYSCFYSMGAGKHACGTQVIYWGTSWYILVQPCPIITMNGHGQRLWFEKTWLFTLQNLLVWRL